MTVEKLVQNFANATGIIIDHTLKPPRVLGQAFIVSKSRLVACAGSVFNYTEAPWALSVNFPHPGISLGVKSVSLHPDFDRKEARTNYLNQTAISRYTYPVQFNDLATIVIQPELRQPAAEEIVQLHKALSIPFSREGVEVSGPLKENDILEVVKKLLASKRQGLLTVYDELNIPLGYIQLSPGMIDLVYFQGVVGEMAFAELIYRQSPKGFAFQPNYNFAWGDLRKIEMSAQDLIAESVRRAHELPGIINQLGGSRACYQRVVSEFSVDSFNQNVQWLVNNLWRAIDGYITIDQLSERVGADTYTMAQGLRELANHGVVSLINKTSPFPLGGQLGTPIVSHTDFDINPGDALKAFYLDPVSGAPCWQDGEFAGVASVLQPKNLLHSIAINLRVPGALILKNYRLIGIHNGAVQQKAGQSAAERQLFQMMWIGALFEMSSKKLRAAEGEDSDEVQSASGGRLTGLRVRGEEETKITSEKLEKYTCPTCFAINTQLGNCFNCGAVIESKPVTLKQSGFFITKVPVPAISELQEKYQISDKKLFAILGSLVLVLALIAITSVSHPPAEVAHVAAPPSNKNAEQAVKLAVGSVGFKGITPPGYWFEDTSSVTNPLPSFGISSDASNQKIVFVIFNDLSPVQALDRFIQIPPFSDVVSSTEGPPVKITEGSQILGDGAFHYFVYNYFTANNAKKIMLVGSFAAKEPGKGVLVLGQALKEGNYDYKSTLFLVDAMAEPLTNAGNQKRLGHIAANTDTSKASAEKNASNQNSTANPSSLNQSDNKNASEEELHKYCELLQEKLQKRVEQSAELQDVIKKRKTGKLKIIMDIDLAADGSLRKMEITEPDPTQKVNDALVKIIKAASPFENVPKTESGLCNLHIVFNRSGEIKVELQ